MERSMTKARDDVDSYGAEALPAGFGELRKALLDGTPAGARRPSQPPPAPVVGLIALAAHWMNKRSGA